MGFVALSKGLALVFFPLTILVLLAYFRRKAWRWVAFFSLAALLWVLPWTWRNWRQTHALIPIHIDSGYNFYLGNGFARHWIEAPFSYVDLKELTLGDLRRADPDLAGTALDPLRRDQALLQLALRQLISFAISSVTEGPHPEPDVLVPGGRFSEELADGHLANTGRAGRAGRAAARLARPLLGFKPAGSDYRRYGGRCVGLRLRPPVVYGAALCHRVGLVWPLAPAVAALSGRLTRLTPE